MSPSSESNTWNVDFLSSKKEKNKSRDHNPRLILTPNRIHTASINYTFDAHGYRKRKKSQGSRWSGEKKGKYGTGYIQETVNYPTGFASEK